MVLVIHIPLFSLLITQSGGCVYIQTANQAYKKLRVDLIKTAIVSTVAKRGRGYWLIT